MITIGLGVSSSVSVYKACEVLRGFQRRGCAVRVVMTANAARLVSPFLFGTLSGSKAIAGLFDEPSEWSVAHVALAKEISLLCVAPATANVIGKFAAGVADDALTTLYLAARCPVLIAPAMNEAMLDHAAVRANVEALRARGVRFVEPEPGYLACGDEGRGRLADPARIVEEGMALLGARATLRGRTVVVTAGPTREPLDPVRFVSNPSTGRMGFALAEEARDRGAEVRLVCGPGAAERPAGIAAVEVVTTAEMERAVADRAAGADVVVMAAAPADFGFARTFDRKVPKGELPPTVALAPTPDILRGLAARRRPGQVLVGFAAETGDAPGRAVAKMIDKGVDLMVANDVSEEGVGFGSDFNRVTLLRPGREPVTTGRLPKREIARRIWDEVEEILRARQG